MSQRLLKNVSKHIHRFHRSSWVHKFALDTIKENEYELPQCGRGLCPASTLSQMISRLGLSPPRSAQKHRGFQLEESPQQIRVQSERRCRLTTS